MSTEASKIENEFEETLTTGQLFFELIKVIVLALVIIIPVRALLFQPFFVSGQSMEPNFDEGQYLVISEFGYKTTESLLGIPFGFTIRPYKDLHRGDITVFEVSKNPETYYIKRAIGLPGESIEIKRGRVVIYNSTNPEGIFLDESGYLSQEALSSLQDMPRVPLGENEYFLMGDNRSHSHDSRSIGPVKRGQITGRVLLRAWPLDTMKIF